MVTSVEGTGGAMGSSLTDGAPEEDEDEEEATGGSK